MTDPKVITSTDFDVSSAGEAILQELANRNAGVNDGITVLLAVLGFLMDQGQVKAVDNGIVKAEYTPQEEEEEIPEPANTNLH